MIDIYKASYYLAFMKVNFINKTRISFDANYL